MSAHLKKFNAIPLNVIEAKFIYIHKSTSITKILKYKHVVMYLLSANLNLQCKDK